MTRVVLASDRILLANVGESTVLDMIQIQELLDVTVLYDDEETCIPNFEVKGLVQISTDPGGFNRGRIYRFRPTSIEFETKLCELRQKCQVVRNRGAKHVLLAIRQSVKTWYESDKMRYFMAFMIMGVSTLISRCSDNL